MLVALTLMASTLAACGGEQEGSGRTTLNWYNFPDDSGALQKAADRCGRASGGRYRISYNKLPRGADGQRQQLVRRLAAQDESIDIMGLDVTWTAEFAEARWIREWTGEAKRRATAGTLRVPLRTATWKNRLYAVPYNTNTQLLWYRKDLVPTPPRTWSEMLDMSRELARQGKPHYVEIQGAQYEGLTVWFNTLVNSAGGAILDPSATAPSLGPPAVRAAALMRDLAGSPAADPSLPNQMEDQNRLAMESGVAAFELNYPFVYPSMKANNPRLFEDFRWAPYPRVDPAAPPGPPSAASTSPSAPTPATRTSPSRRPCACATGRTSSPPHSTVDCRPPCAPCTTSRRSRGSTPSPRRCWPPWSRRACGWPPPPTRTCRSSSPTHCPRRPPSSRRARSPPSGTRSTTLCDPRV
ncbi:extracellular solute-binding protein [Streptomyces sp. INA 01156]